MAAFPKMTLTNAGQALQTKVLAGAQLTFTRIALGDGQLNDQPISLLTDMIHQTASVEVDTVRVMSASTCQVAGFFSNATISTGFQWRETGLFAQDPDAGEILYGYTNAGGAGDYIPTVQDTRIEKYIYCSIAVANATTVDITIPSSDTFIPMTQKGQAGGVPPLDEHSKIPEEYLPAVIQEGAVTIPEGGEIVPPEGEGPGPWKLLLSPEEETLEAGDVSYDNAASGMTAKTVQAALDEIAQSLDSGTVTARKVTAAAAGWSGELPTQSLAVEGVAADTLCWVGLDSSATPQQRDAARKAVICPTGQGPGTITLACDGVRPAVDLPILIYVSGGVN